MCSFAAFYCHILCFLRFFVFNWNASIVLASKSSLCKLDHFSRDTSRVSVRPIKTFLHDKPKRKFFPEHAGEREAVQFPEEFANF